MVKKRVQSPHQKMALKIQMVKKMRLNSNSESEDGPDGDITPEKKAQGEYDMKKTVSSTSFALCTTKS